MKLAKGIVFGFIMALCLSFTYTYDTATPIGTDAPSTLDDQIRLPKQAIQERMNVDHYWPLTGTEVSDAAAGQHRQIEFYGPISKPTNAANKMFVYGKDVDGKIELHVLDEDGNEIQITTAGILNSVNLTGNQTVAGTKTFSGQITSTLATGTSPLSVSSTTKVTNLNADEVDGYSISSYGGGESYSFPGGLVIKSGKDTSTSDGEETFTFATEFPVECQSVAVTRGDANGQYPLCVSSISVSSFKIDRWAAIDGNVDFYWIAVGK